MNKYADSPLDPSTNQYPCNPAKSFQKNREYSLRNSFLKICNVAIKIFEFISAVIPAGIKKTWKAFKLNFCSVSLKNMFDLSTTTNNPVNKKTKKEKTKIDQQTINHIASQVTNSIASQIVNQIAHQVVNQIENQEVKHIANQLTCNNVLNLMQASTIHRAIEGTTKKRRTSDPAPIKQEQVSVEEIAKLITILTHLGGKEYVSIEGKKFFGIELPSGKDDEVYSLKN